MREIIMMLERELSNDGLIYIYRESDGKWYAYEQSAFYLSRMMLELSLDRYVMENALWLARALGKTPRHGFPYELFLETG